MITQFTLEYEKALAFQIEENVRQAKVKMWGDLFATDSSPHVQSTVFVRHDYTERDFLVVDPSTKKRIYTKTLTFEIGVEVYTTKNHHEAQNLIEFIMDDVLAGFKPYLEFSAFEPGKSGEGRREKNRNCWIYSGSGTTSIRSSCTEITRTSDDIGEPRIVQVRYFPQANDTNIIAAYNLKE